MKVGINVPYTRSDPAAVLSMVDIAEQGGIDGVFVSDHLWPMGKQSGVTLSAFPMLAALAARTERIAVGTLVARVGLSDLMKPFSSLQAIAGNRLIAGLGIGDAISKPENDAYDVEFRPRDQRLRMLDELCVQLKAHRIETWLGGRSDAIQDLADKHHVAVNEWESTIGDSGAHGAHQSPMVMEKTWGGRVLMDGIADKLQELREARITWAVLLITGSGKDPVKAAELAVEAKGSVSF